MFCKHDWDLIRTDRLPSAWEQMGPVKSFKSQRTSGLLFQVKLVHVFKCKKCGKVKTSEHVNV
jgi:hypothetical protein